LDAIRFEQFLQYLLAREIERGTYEERRLQIYDRGARSSPLDDGKLVAIDGCLGVG
jgi:hypothetical protein